MAKQGDGPPEDGQKWVRADEAAKRVGLTPAYFGKTMRKWEMTRYRPRQGAAYWYLETEIESWAEWKRLKRRWHAKHHRSGLPRWTEAISLEDARRLCITVEETAAILGITSSTVRGMVWRGKLVCYQHRPQQKGSRLWFSRRAVEQLRDDPEHQKRRTGYARGREQGASTNSAPKPGRAVKRPRGLPEDWLTTREAAARLGVHPSRVRGMRETGRLRGERLWRYNRPMRNWYFLEGDVEALKADPLYQEVRTRYLTAHSPERQQAREAERLKKLAEWTLRVNGWDDPWHTFDYQAAPGDVW